MRRTRTAATGRIWYRRILRTTPTLVLALVGIAFAAIVGALLSAGAPDVGAATIDAHKAFAADVSVRPKSAPLVVRSTTGKKPPKSVRFTGEPMGMAVSGDGTTSAGAPGEVIIPGVPGYLWRLGCGPAALGMVVGYYDGHGWDALIPGDATSVTPAVNQAIASDATSGSPGHYEDYSLPKETSVTLLPDRSELPAGDEHASNCVADFLRTSWSYYGLHYGCSYSSMIGPAFTDYLNLKYPDATPHSSTYSDVNLTWELVKAEVDGNRPMVFVVDSTGDGAIDHFVCVVGYRETNGVPEYGCWDTWNNGLLRWQQFRSLSSAYDWGVWGAITFSIDQSVPEPQPTPTPTSPADTTAPVTAVSGGDDAWHVCNVTLAFSASDDASGVARTEYSLDGGVWTTGTSLTLAPGKRGVNSGVHAVAYRSVDGVGNIEPDQFVYVKLDGKPPVTTSNAGASSYSGSFTLLLSPTDGHSGVASTSYSLDGKTYKDGTSIQVTGKGAHTVKFYSVDVAGNSENVKSVRVVIK